MQKISIFFRNVNAAENPVTDSVRSPLQIVMIVMEDDSRVLSEPWLLLLTNPWVANVLAARKNN